LKFFFDFKITFKFNIKPKKEQMRAIPKISKRSITLFSIMMFLSLSIFSQNEKQNQSPAETIKIDKITIKKNWITWDLIIKNELEFKEGQMVSYGEIDTSMKKLWNIGNFANVDYSIKPEGTGNTLEITALDAVKFYPLITIDRSSENDYHYQLGYGDENFLGSNTKLRIAWDKKPTGSAWDVSLKFPRQLMYENMTIETGFVIGNDIMENIDRIIYQQNKNIDSVVYLPTMLDPYKKKEFYMIIGNPWQLDYKYRFSPDLTIRYMHHESNLSLLNSEEIGMGTGTIVAPFNYNMLSLTLNESMGIVNHKRHRLDGYTIGGSVGVNLGLNSESPTYESFGLTAEYYKILNDIFQITTWLRTTYSTAATPYKTILSSADVLGIRNGEIYGKSTYAAYVGMHCTWLNKNWLSVENAYFVNFGAGTDNYFDLFSTKPKVAVGTSFRFEVPVAPLLSFKLSFMYAGPGSDWFKFNM
jgi:outer membrane protein assembly factor BamA